MKMKMKKTKIGIFKFIISPAGHIRLPLRSI